MIKKMKNLIVCSLLFIFFIPITNCGFKVLDRTNLNYDIAKLTTSGEKRINFKIKNKLLFNSSNSNKKLINIDINSKKIKNVKEKNIKNEVTKYDLKIEVTVKFNEISNSKKNEFKIQVSGSYDVASQFSQTLTNERKLIETLSEKIAEEINDNLIFRLNDI